MSLTQYYAATTLDGFIAGANNSLDWLLSRDSEDDGPSAAEGRDALVATGVSPGGAWR